MKEKGGLSSSQEDYLKQIYVLAQRSEVIGNFKTECKSGDEYPERAGIY